MDRAPECGLKDVASAIQEKGAEEVDRARAPQLNRGAQSGKKRQQRNVTHNPNSRGTRSYIPLRLESGKNIFTLFSQEILQLCPAISGSECTILLIKPDETLYFVGKIRLALLHGSVSLMGTAIKSSSTFLHVFAPKTHSLPSLVGNVPDTSTGESMAAFPGRILEHLELTHSVVAMTKDTSGLDFLSRLSPTFEGLFDVDWENGETFLPGFYPLQSPSQDPVTLKLPKSWSEALQVVDDLDSASTSHQNDLNFRSFVGLVKGIKGAGKSTFARILLNTLLTRHERVAFLDCDLGQSEFTPGGVVSIHVLNRPFFGPPFTHQLWPHKAHFIGSFTPRARPSHYLTCIADLLEVYRLDIQSYEIDGEIRIVPLVINTQGWIKGLGGELLHRIEDMACPSHYFIFQTGEDLAPAEIRAKSPRSSFQPLVLWLEVQANPNPRYTSTDLRNLSMMAYLHSAQPSRSYQPICSMLPWEIDTTVAYDSILLLGSGGEDVDGSMISDALQGGLVGIVMDSTGEGLKNKFVQSLVPYDGSDSFPSPSTSQCLGMGIVRWISRDARTLHLVTPLPAHALASCRSIIKGDMELPLWALLPYAMEGLDDSDLEGQFMTAPFLSWGTSRGLGVAKWKFRRNILRRIHM